MWFQAKEVPPRDDCFQWALSIKACLRLDSLHTFARFFWKLVIQISLSSWRLKKKKVTKIACTRTHTHTHTPPSCMPVSSLAICSQFPSQVLYSISSVIPQGTSLPIPFLGILFPGYTNNITWSTPKCLWLTTLFLKNVFLELQPILPTTYLTSPNWMPQEQFTSTLPIGSSSLSPWHLLFLLHLLPQFTGIIMDLPLSLKSHIHSISSLVSSTPSTLLKLVYSSPRPRLQLNTLLTDPPLKLLSSLTSSSASTPQPV